MNDLERTDYDVSEIDEDPRMARARKEALITQVFLTAGIFIVILVAFITGAGNDPNAMTFVLGWPLWFVLGVITSITIIVVSLTWVMRYLSCPSLEAVADDKEVE